MTFPEGRPAPPGEPGRRVYRECPKLARWVAVVCLLLVADTVWARSDAWPSARTTRQDQGAVDPRSELERILRSYAEDESGRRGPAVEELRRLGPAVLPVLLERVASMPPTADAELRVLLSAFTSFPSRQTRPLLERVIPSASIQVRDFVLSALGETGSAVDLDLLERLARTEEDPARIVKALEQALVRLFGRDRAAFDGLTQRVHELPAPIRPPFVRAVGSSESPEGMNVLFELLNAHEDLEQVSLGAIAELARSTAPILDEFRLEMLRKHLDPFYGQVRPEALRAVGRLEDFESVPELIAFLDGNQLDLRAAALEALRTMSGLSFGSDPDRWRSWYETESRWWRERGSLVLASMNSDDPAELIGALSEVLCHRLYRSRLLEPVVRLLDHPDPKVRRLACIGLPQFSSVHAVDPLRTRLEDEDAAVRAEARRALEILSEGPASETTHAWNVGGK